MIERFNFYDVYGYLLPGLALIGLVWLPFLILKHKWPENELLSAVVVLAIGYVVGHVLQNVATTAFPSTFSDAHGRRRYPSDLLLDETNWKLSSEMKTRIREKVKQQFSIDLSNGGDGAEDVSRCRRDMFLMARQKLIHDKVAGYAEQFEGLYAMMRGLAVATSLASLYLYCWALAIFKSRCAWYAALVILIASLALVGTTGGIRVWKTLRDSQLRVIDKITVAGFAGCASSTAYLLGFDRLADVSYSIIFLLLGTICSVLSLRFCIGYKSFAFEFASNIWRNYAYQPDAVASESDA